MLNAVIRTDASLHIGSGHVMRCLVLADALKQVGYEVTFLTRPQKADLISVIKQRGFLVVELEKPFSWSVPKSTSDYAAWLQVNEIDDANECASLFKSVDLMVVDHYGIGINWHKKLRNAYGCKIVVIDDLVRQHDADLIVDQTLLRTVNEYLSLNPKSKILAGTDYAILHPNFTHMRSEKNTMTRFLSKRPRVLVSMGGVDQPNATLQVLKALKHDLNEHPLVTVLLSPRAPHYHLVQSFVANEQEWVTHIDFVEDMAELMCRHDVAIGAPGSTTWERACLGMPSIMVALADNQHTICQRLTSIGASLSVELKNIRQDLVPVYNKLLSNFEAMRDVNLELCDGKGVERILANLKPLFGPILSLRHADVNDIQQVYVWQCAPETRRYALNTEVPSFAEHQTWMSQKLTSESDYFYIIELTDVNSEKTMPMGVVRLDMTAKDTYTLSIFIAPAQFGKGIAKLALKKIDIMHPKAVINAVVLKENIASQTLFSRAGYVKVGAENYTRQPLV